MLFFRNEARFGMYISQYKYIYIYIYCNSFLEIYASNWGGTEKSPRHMAPFLLSPSTMQLTNYVIKRSPPKSF